MGHLSAIARAGSHVDPGLIQVNARGASRAHTAAMTDRLPFDADLLRRYDRPGPRYTSYPTAPQFDSGFDEAMLRDCIRRSNADPIPRRLSLYVHIPPWVLRCSWIYLTPRADGQAG